MKLRYNCPRQTRSLWCSIMTISYSAYRLGDDTVTVPALDAQVAARLHAAFADLASGRADRSGVEEALRAIRRGAEAAGSPAGVVVALCEAATSAIETARASQR